MKNNSKYAQMTGEEAIHAILEDAGMKHESISMGMESVFDNIFREGWLRGEEYQYNISK